MGVMKGNTRSLDYGSCVYIYISVCLSVYLFFEGLKLCETPYGVRDIVG